MTNGTSKAKNVRIIDPTKNVRRELRQIVKRQDDLRRVAHNGLRGEVNLEVKSIHREIKDFKSFIKKINIAETKRIDAIRSVDQGNVVIANTAAENRASTLAKQVADTAVAQVVSLKAETDPIRKSVDDLRQSQWTIAGGTAQGKEEVGDSRAKNANWGIWVGIAAAVIFGIATFTFNVVSIVVAVIAIVVL